MRISQSELMIPPQKNFFQVKGHCTLPNASLPQYNVTVLSSLVRGGDIAKRGKNETSWKNTLNNNNNKLVWSIAETPSVVGGDLLSCVTNYSRSVPRMITTWVEVSNKDIFKTFCVYNSAQKTVDTQEVCELHLIYYPLLLNTSTLGKFSSSCRAVT